MVAGLSDSAGTLAHRDRARKSEVPKGLMALEQD